MKKISAFNYLAIGIGVCVILLFISIYFYSQKDYNIHSKGDNMKAPKSKGLTMEQLKYYKSIAKGSSKKKDWQGRINELAGKPAYKNWLKKNK